MIEAKNFPTVNSHHMEPHTRRGMMATRVSMFKVIWKYHMRARSTLTRDQDVVGQ